METNRMSTKSLEYLAPHMQIVMCKVEMGFANTLEDPTVNPEIDW